MGAAERGDAVAPISDRERAVLEIAAAEWRSPGEQELAIRQRLGFGRARYTQLLNALLDSPAALQHDPMLVMRLRRIRDARIDARRARRIRPRPSGPHAD